MTTERAIRAADVAATALGTRRVVGAVAPVLAAIGAGATIAFLFIPNARWSALFALTVSVACTIAAWLNVRGRTSTAGLLLLPVLVIGPAIEPVATGNLSTNAMYVGLGSAFALLVVGWPRRWWVLGGAAASLFVMVVTTAPNESPQVAWLAAAVNGAIMLAISLALAVTLLRTYWDLTARARAARRLAERRAADLIETNAGLTDAVATRQTELTAAIAQRRKVAEQLAQTALTDPLTGLRNRRFLADEWPLLCHGDSGVAIVDVDSFKHINDRLSYQVGDQALREIAEVLQRGVRPGDAVVRYGGEEFAVLLPGTRQEEAQARAEALRRSIADHDWSRIHPDLNVTVSVGLSFRSGNRPSATDHESAAQRAKAMLREADAALYRAKSEGGDTVVWAAPPR